jgi:hypothetical protein
MTEIAEQLDSPPKGDDLDRRVGEATASLLGGEVVERLFYAVRLASAAS